MLPRLDSNQQPSGYASSQASGTVIDLVAIAERRRDAGRKAFRTDVTRAELGGVA